MTDYSDIGLTEQLNSETSVLEKDTGYTDSLNFEASIVDRGYIKTVDISDSSVTSAKLASGVITAAKIAGSAIAGTHLSNESVDSISIAGSAVDGTHIADATLDSIHFGGSVIDGTHIGTNTIAADSIQEDSLTSTQIGTFDYGEGTGNITAGTINSTAGYEANGTVGIDSSFTILDGDGATNHDFVFTDGLLTSYGTS